MPSGADDPKLAYKIAVASSPGGGLSHDRPGIPGAPLEEHPMPGAPQSGPPSTDSESSGASDADFDAMEAAAYEEEDLANLLDGHREDGLNRRRHQPDLHRRCRIRDGEAEAADEVPAAVKLLQLE